MPATAKSFHKELLPPPEAFYRREFGQRLSRSSRGWVRTNCVFHQPDRNPSLNLNLSSGGFYCFACGAKGGDVVDFVRMRDGISFRAAATALGALADDDEQARLQIAQRKREKQRAAAEAEALRAEERSLRLGLRGDIRLYERVIRDAGAALEGADAETAETSWQIMASATDLMRWALAGYTLLAFGSQLERVEYVRNPDRRATIEDLVLSRGWVRDDAGRIAEVLA